MTKGCLLGDGPLRQRMALAGRRLVEEEFSEQRLIERSEDLYLRAWETYERSRRQVGRLRHRRSLVPTGGTGKPTP